MAITDNIGLAGFDSYLTENRIGKGSNGGYYNTSDGNQINSDVMNSIKQSYRNMKDPQYGSGAKPNVSNAGLAQGNRTNYGTGASGDNISETIIDRHGFAPEDSVNTYSTSNPLQYDNNQLGSGKTTLATGGLAGLGADTTRMDALSNPAFMEKLQNDFTRSGGTGAVDVNSLTSEQLDAAIASSPSNVVSNPSDGLAGDTGTDFSMDGLGGTAMAGANLGLAAYGMFGKGGSIDQGQQDLKLKKQQYQSNVDELARKKRASGALNSAFTRR